MLIVLVTVFCMSFVGAQQWDQNLVLDPEGNYRLYWTLNGDTIVFQVEVATTGWVGFGLSPNGGMGGSDVVIGWIDSGETIFNDRHAVGKFLPVIDKHQDWELLWSHENDTHTLIRFQRELNTCDDEDRPIAGPTMRLIFAYGDKDPDSAESVAYHGPEYRGTRTVSLLQETKEKPELGAPEDLRYWEVRSRNVAVPHDVDTSYICTVIKRPELDRLHHIIKVDTIIQPGHERLVHHALLGECTNASEAEFEPLLNGYHECYTEDRIPLFSSCFTVTTVWAVGGEAIYLPENVGLPLGRENAVYYVLEMHYDNPGYKKGIIDSSGLRLTYTPKLRKYDGGVLAIGNLWYPCMFIPPKQKDFVVSGHAHPACLRQDIPDDGIQIFGTLLHTHVTGKKIKIRHFRDSQELPPICSDDNYDFNYQNFAMFSEERRILPNDHVIVECSYDTSTRKETTFGGLSTRSEMCIAFLLYYPEIQLSMATSCPAPFNLVKLLGVTQMSNDDRYVVSPITGKNQSYIDFLNSYPWDDNSVNAIQIAMKYSPQLNMCTERGGTPKLVFTLSRYPKLNKTYQEPDVCAGHKPNEDNSYSETVEDIAQNLPYYVSQQIGNERN